ncbi:hypothetical protein [Nonomuraea candida]|uniref:hypothetical protein n=1 Tax=Nonomuraea candida TaxID=359159 RepID=UPI0005B7BD9C|nr:hypothetical protein [Nonomuraea candida]
MLTPDLLRLLAEDLRVAIATGEVPREAAIHALQEIGGVDRKTALRVWRDTDPMGQGNVWDIPGGSQYRPRYGLARRVWDHTDGPLQGKRVMPALILQWGPDIARYAAVTQ